MVRPTPYAATNIDLDAVLLDQVIRGNKAETERMQAAGQRRSQRANAFNEAIAGMSANARPRPNIGSQINHDTIQSSQMSPTFQTLGEQQAFMDNKFYYGGDPNAEMGGPEKDGPWSKYAQPQQTETKPAGPWAKYQGQPTAVTQSGRKPGDPGYDPLEQTYTPDTVPDEDPSWLWTTDPDAGSARETIGSRIGEAFEDLTAPLMGNRNDGVRGTAEFAGMMGEGLKTWATDTMVNDPARGIAEADRVLNPGTMAIHGNLKLAEGIDSAREGEWTEAGQKAAESLPDLIGAASFGIPASSSAKAAGTTKAAGRVGAGEVARTLDAVAIVNGGVRPQSVEAWRRVLRNSGVPRDVVSDIEQRAIDAFGRGGELGSTRPAFFAQLLQRELAKDYPQAAENVGKVIRSFSLSTKKGREAGSIVNRAVGEARGDQTSFLQQSASRNLGDEARISGRARVEKELRRIGDDGYEPFLNQPIAPAQAQAIQSVLKGPGMDDLMRPLREIAAGEGVSIDDFIAQQPLRAAHWMQHKAGLIADDAYNVNNKTRGRAYATLRDRIRDNLKGLKDPQGRSYADLVKEFGDEAGIIRALDAGNRFGGLVRNPEGADTFVEAFRAMTADQQQGALSSIRDWVSSRLRGAPEDAPARIAELQNTGVLQTLDELGGGAKQLADDIRAIRQENADLAQYSNRGQSATAPNAQIMEEAPNLYSGGARASLPASAGMDVLTMASGLSSAPIFSLLKAVPWAREQLLTPKNATLNDMARIGMARQNPLESAAPRSPPKRNALSDATPDIKPTGVRGNAFSEDPQKAGVKGVLAEAGVGSAGGSVLGSQVDLTGDGEVDWKDALAAGAIGAGAVPWARWTLATTPSATRKAPASPHPAVNREEALGRASAYTPGSVSRAGGVEDWRRVLYSNDAEQLARDLGMDIAPSALRRADETGERMRKAVYEARDAVLDDLGRGSRIDELKRAVLRPDNPRRDEDLVEMAIRMEQEGVSGRDIAQAVRKAGGYQDTPAGGVQSKIIDNHAGDDLLDMLIPVVERNPKRFRALLAEVRDPAHESKSLITQLRAALGDFTKTREQAAVEEWTDDMIADGWRLAKEHDPADGPVDEFIARHHVQAMRNAPDFSRPKPTAEVVPYRRPDRLLDGVPPKGGRTNSFILEPEGGRDIFGPLRRMLSPSERAIHEMRPPSQKSFKDFPPKLQQELMMGEEVAKARAQGVPDEEIAQSLGLPDAKIGEFRNASEELDRFEELLGAYDWGNPHIRESFYGPNDLTQAQRQSLRKAQAARRGTSVKDKRPDHRRQNPEKAENPSGEVVPLRPPPE